MNPSSIETQTLMDIGKLYLFVWRTRSIGYNETLPRDLGYEYDAICRQYNKTPVGDPHTHVNRILKTILRKLEGDMKSLDRHVPVSHVVHKGYITAVECSCGETTKYKVPLKIIEDFNCPKEGRKR